MTDIHVQHQGQGPRLSPVQSTVTQRHQPSGVGVNVGSSTQGVGAMGREYKDQGEEALYSAERTAERSMEQLKHAGEKAYDKICAVCHNPRQYPKLLTTVVLLSCFLLGSLTTGVVTKMVPSLGGSRHYVSSHWDKETAHAHHLLDVVIDQVKHPHLYEGQKSTSYVNQARNTLMDLFSGILPGRKKHPMKGQPMFDPRTGRKLGSKMGEMMEDVGDTASDIYNVGMRTAKKAGRKIGDVASDAASSVKGVFSQDATYPVHDESSWSHGGGGWFGGSEWHGDENNEELTEATSQLRNIIRKAERNQ